MRPRELRVPPVAVTLVAAALMGLAAWATPSLRVVVPAGHWIAVGVALLGGLISALAVASFKRARTTVNPMTPDASSALVRTGLFRLTRNPMYLGFALLLAAWAVYLANGAAGLLVAGFVLYMNRHQIEPEERALTARFGQAFVDYASQVRRWL
jgi:protein-S-isoprenylcysteine O-methyltransferase Ste14